MDYYECADKGYGKKGFARVERRRFPHLQEGERLVPTMEFGFDRAKRQGMRKGKQLGIEQGKQDAAKRMLARGMSDDQICDVLQLSAKELIQIKGSLNQN